MTQLWETPHLSVINIFPQNIKKSLKLFSRANT